jgi:hypothetical protein
MSGKSSPIQKWRYVYESAENAWHGRLSFVGPVYRTICDYAHANEFISSWPTSISWLSDFDISSTTEMSSGALVASLIF